VSRRWVMLLVVFFARTSLGFQFQSIAALTPFLLSAFDLSYAQVGLLMGLYMLPGVIMAVPGGLLGQRFGSLRVVVAGLLLMLVGGTVVAYGGSFAVAMTGRVLAGVGAVLVNIMLTRIVAEWFRGREIQTAMSVMLASWPFGMALALIILGPLAAATSWRLAEYLTVAAAGLALAAVVLFYQDPPAEDGPAEPAALRLGMPGRVWALAISAGVAWALLNASLIVVASFAPSFLMSHDFSVGEAGFLTGIALWISILSIPLGGFVADRLNRPRLQVVIGCLGAAVGIVCIDRAPLPALWMVASGIVLGLSPGIIMSLLPKSVRSEHLATAFGVYYALFYLGMAFSQTAAGYVRDVTGDPGMPLLFAAVLLALTVVALVAFRRIEGTAEPV
jgi:MFS family permease